MNPNRTNPKALAPIESGRRAAPPGRLTRPA